MLMSPLETFLNWEKTTRDTIDFKRIYVDMAGDLISGLLLSQIVYWHLPGPDGKTRLRVEKDGHLWLAKNRGDWWDEIRITPKQVDRAINILSDRGLVVYQNSLFAGKRTPFIRINPDGFMAAWNSQTEIRGEHRYLPLGNTDSDERATPITESTSENTTDNECANAPGEEKEEKTDTKNAQTVLVTPGQRMFLDLFGAKRFKTKIQKERVGQLENDYGIDKLRELAEWAAIKGMSLGGAIGNVERALKKQAKQNGRTVVKVGR